MWTSWKVQKWLGCTYGSEEGDGITSLDGTIGLGHEGRESLDGQGRVALRARGDEAGSEGVDLIEAQRCVKGLREGDLVERGANVGRVTGLDSEDGPGGGQVGLAHDVGGSTEVG